MSASLGSSCIVLRLSGVVSGARQNAWSPLGPSSGSRGVLLGRLEGLHERPGVAKFVREGTFSGVPGPGNR
eukprot:9454251-Pyramimonas_sp.AAC.1